MGRARLKRGDIVSAVLSRDYGKPRPVLIIQSDRLIKLGSVVVCPLTSDVDDTDPLRIRLQPSVTNGLRSVSDIMIDKVSAIPRDRCREIIGMVEQGVMERAGGILAVVLGLAG